MKKEFCTNCRKEVAYCIEEFQREAELKGEKYSYIRKVAKCKECGEEIYIAELNDANLKALYDQYRLRNGIVSLEIIMEIPKKYRIGKRPLSLMLGWGEQTYSRYCDGDLPTRQYSEILKQIYEQPRFYMSLLEQNKGRLKSEEAYLKSKKAVEECLKKESETKLKLAAEYLIERCGDITALALQKALYYVQGLYYAFQREYIFSEDCEAWAHGPVYREIYNKYCNYHYEPINQSLLVDTSRFTTIELTILESVIENLCCYSGKVLERFTHLETPWLSARGELAPEASSNEPITKQAIGEYFLSVKEKYNMITPNDIRAYARDMFSKL